MPRVLDEDFLKQIVKDYCEKEMTYSELAREYKTSTASVGYALKRFGVKPRAQGVRKSVKDKIKLLGNKLNTIKHEHCKVEGRLCCIFDLEGSCDICREYRENPTSICSRMDTEDVRLS